ncbi:hypothetical protein DLM78_14480 [Leptospira stimsonii]|uniref:Uncharacterized protein n=2 Tax=Leptospira stimsonii TaxID=2202203 RepID=A0A8B3CNG1_9LEPT|nr:hypothetical protein DLM78_14480 [Leptospira stimsonii]
MFHFLNRIESLDAEKNKMSEVIETADGGWEGAILVCSQCAGKIPGERFLGKSRIKNELKTLIRSEKIAGVRVLEVSCLNVCEKNRIAIANTLFSEPGKKIAMVPAKTSAKRILNFFEIERDNPSF